MRFLIIFIYLFTNFEISVGQQLFYEKFSQNVYNAGLQNNDFAQDKDGIIYCANSDGVLTYDGIKWGLLNTTNHDFVSSLALNQKGDIFIGSSFEFGFFKKNNLGNYTYNSLLTLLPKSEQGIGYIDQTILIDDDIFYCNSNKIYKFYDGNFRIYPIKHLRLFKLYNKLYVLTENGLFKYEKGNFIEVKFGKDLKLLDIISIAEYQNNKYLLLTKKGSVFVFNSDEKPNNRITLFKQLPKPYFKFDPYITQINYLKNNIISITSGFGIIFINKSGQITNYIIKDLLGSAFPFSPNFIDKDNNLWLGFNHAIIQIHTNSPLSYSNQFNGLGTEEKTIIAIGKDKNQYYIGTDVDLYSKYNKSYFPKLGKIHYLIGGIYNFENQTILIGANGVFQLINKKLINISPILYVRSICNLKNSPYTYIFGTEDTGLWLLKKVGGKWVTKKINGFDDGVFNLFQSDEEFWVSQINKGIIKVKLNASHDSVINLTNYGKINGLPSNINNRIYKLLDGKLIFTTINGIYKFNNNKFEPDQRFDFESTKGWCIYTLTETANGDIYFWGAPTKDLQTVGLLAKQPNGNYKLSPTPFSKISLKTNNLRVDVDAPLFTDSNNEVLLGYKGNLITFNSNQHYIYNKTFETKVCNVWAKQKMLYKEGSSSIISEIPYDLNTLKISFRSTFLESASENKYQYKLEGFENKWSDWNSSSEADFTNLDDGYYNFSVRTKNVYGILSKPTVFSFYIKPPWYKTWVAHLFYLIGGLLLLYFGNTLNTMRLKRIRARLKQMVDQQTGELINKSEEILAQKKALEALNVTKDKLFSIISHDLKGPLAQLKSTFDLIDSGVISIEDLQVLLPMLNLSIGSTLNLADNLLYWAKSQLEGIQVRKVWFDLKEIINENYDLFEARALSKSIEIENNVDKSVMIYADKDMIDLVLRNLIANAVKFTNEYGKITIGCETVNGFIKTFVQDTGTGLTKEEIENIFSKGNFFKNGTSGEKGSGLGLIICQDFIEKNGGSLEIESLPNLGSKFIFSLPNIKN